MAGGDGFLSRWSRRKAQAKSAPAVDSAAPPAPTADLAAASATSAPGTESSSDPHAGAESAATAPALPTLADVARLTHESDYSPYVARDVDAAVRNAAMRKLFSDPRFNVMDGLDTYIDDYGKPDPIPPEMLRRMNQSAVLGLFADEADAAGDDAAPAAPPAKASPDGAVPGAVAQSTTTPAVLAGAPESGTDDDPDLQLQPDDADRPGGAGARPRP
jgi:hypothetical protein